MRDVAMIVLLAAAFAAAAGYVYACTALIRSAPGTPDKPR